MASIEKLSSSSAFEGTFRRPMGPKKKQTVRFRCGDRRWDISISVAIVNSTVLWKYFDNPNNLPQERTLGTDDEAVGAAVIQYLETGNYEDTASKNDPVATPMHHAKILNVGKTYEINGLGNLAYTRFFDRLGPPHGFWATKAFCDTIKWAFAPSSNDLSNTKVRSAVQNGLAMLARVQSSNLLANGTKFHHFKETVRTTPEFALILLQQFIEPPEASAQASSTKEPESSSSALNVPPSAIPPAAEAAMNSISAEIPSDKPAQLPQRPAPTPVQPVQEALAEKPTTAQPAAVVSRKRKRSDTLGSMGILNRESRKCAVCETTFFTTLPWDRDNIYSRQCRSCADQLERRVNFDEYDAFGRRIF